MDSPNKNLSTVRKGKERISWSLLRFGLGLLLGGGVALSCVYLGILMENQVIFLLSSPP